MSTRRSSSGRVICGRSSSSDGAGPKRRSWILVRSGDWISAKTPPTTAAPIRRLRTRWVRFFGPDRGAQLVRCVGDALARRIARGRDSAVRRKVFGRVRQRPCGTLQYLAQALGAALHRRKSRAPRATRERDGMIGKVTDRFGCPTAVKHGSSGTSTPHAVTNLRSRLPIYGATRMNRHQRIDSTLVARFNAPYAPRGLRIQAAEESGGAMSRRLIGDASRASAVSSGASRNHLIRAAATGPTRCASSGSDAL